MAAKLNKLTHKIAIQLHLVAESCIICSSCSRRTVRELLDTPSYLPVSQVWLLPSGFRRKTLCWNTASIVCLRPSVLLQKFERRFCRRSADFHMKVGYGLDDRGFESRQGLEVSLHHRVQAGSGAHPASYPAGTRGSSSGGKAAEAWSWPFTSI
jgi:hypothetical protein